MTHKVAKIKCLECEKAGVETHVHFLGEHLRKVHSMSIEAYQEKHGVKTPIVSNKLWEAFQSSAEDIQRKGSSRYADLIKVGNVSLQRGEGEITYTFDRPFEYQYPKMGKAAAAVERVARAIKYGRSLYIYGQAGCGKSAGIRALCHDLNMEASHYPMREGMDTELYLGKEAVVIDEETNLNVTKFVKGKLLKDLEGRVGKDGVRRGVLILFDDFDRAPSEYHEVLRHCLEDNARNVFIPELGVNVDLHPDTIIVATANSNGNGDSSGRYASVQTMDWSILDRFQRAVEYHFLEADEEIEILKKKYPEVLKAGGEKPFELIMKVATTIREMIENNEIYASFSHRRIVQWLDSLDELIEENNGRYDQSMLKKSAVDWLDWYDYENRTAVVSRAVDIYIK